MIIRQMEQIDFTKADWVELTHQPWLVPCDITARAALLLCGSRLYVCMEAKEQHIRAEENSPLSSVCCDSCLEFFLAPDPADKRYLNLEWNLNGSLYLGFGAERETRIRQIMEDPRDYFRFTSYRLPDGWRIEYSIPEKLIRTYFPDFRFGGAMAGNLYKCGDLTQTPHYLAWMPLTSDHPDFHRRQDFGELTVE